MIKLSLQLKCICHAAQPYSTTVLAKTLPFPLTIYEEAKSHTGMIVEVTQQRLMPPWIPGPEAAHRFIGQRWLSDRELNLLTDWVKAGCVFSVEADLPPAATFAEGRHLREPDHVVKMKAAGIGAVRRLSDQPQDTACLLIGSFEV